MSPTSPPTYWYDTAIEVVENQNLKSPSSSLEAERESSPSTRCRRTSRPLAETTGTQKACTTANYETEQRVQSSTPP